MDRWDKQHRADLARLERRIKEIYEAAAQEAASIGMMVGELTEDLFTFDKYPLTHERIKKLMKDMHDRMEKAVVDGVNGAWTLANNKNSELARMVFGNAIGHLTKEQYKRYFSNNDTARQAFLARKHNGLGLSDNVWHYTDLYKHEIELGLDIGIRSGMSADVMSRELRSYLQYPDKLFRRVRDEHGQLVLSQAAKAFHPGQGVYRSSYMNARRLAATETNMAYRSADFERYQRFDFIVGIEVHLSNNHTCKGVKGPFIDICDELQGKYPKDFKFTGWHPHCRCYTTTILKTDAEIKEDEKRMMRGLDPLEGSENQVTDVPDGFKTWLSQNESRIGRAKSIPYFLKDNGNITVGKRLVDGHLVAWNKFEIKEFKNPERKLSLLQIAAQRHAARTPQQIAQIQVRADARQKVLKDYALTEKRAGNILNMASGWHEVSFVALQSAVDVVASNSVYRSGEMAELKKALQSTIAEIKQQQAAEKALADIIPDVHKWHQQFTLAELQKVKDSIPVFKAGKAAKYYVSNFEDLPLAKQKQLLMDEAKYVSDATYFKPHTLHKTWGVAKSAYEKQVALVDEAIAWQPVEVKLADIKAYSAANPKSLKITSLIVEAEKLKAAGGSIAEVEAKILEAEKIKAKNEASVLSHAKIAAQKKLKELADLQQKKAELKQKKNDLEILIALAKPSKAPGLPQMKEDLKAVEKELKVIDKKIDKLGGDAIKRDFATIPDSEKSMLIAEFEKKYGSAEDAIESADNMLRPLTENYWKHLSQEEKVVLTKYTQTYSYLNEPLTGRMHSNRPYVEFEKDLPVLTNALNKYTAPQNMVIRRGTNDYYISEIRKNLSSVKVGDEFTNGSFCSSAARIDKGLSGSYELVIVIPKGAHGAYVEPLSHYNDHFKYDYLNKIWNGKDVESFGIEREWIGQRGYRFRVIDKKGRKIYVEVIGELYDQVSDYKKYFTH